jgi:hypothetical protein
MSRLLKTLPLAFALAALSVLAIITISCSTTSSSQAEVRVVNAIPDSPAVDIYINGTKTITNLPFNTVQPDTTPATYVITAGGSATIQGFPTGSTTNPIPPNGAISLSGATQYTVVAIGLELNDSPPLVLADNNTVPTSGNVEFRIVNASPSSPTGGVDVYIVPPNSDITNYTPQISALGNGQGSDYQSLTFAAVGYAVIVTANLGKTPLIKQTYIPQSASITTLVLVDNAGGNNGMSTTPLQLNDLN